MTITKKSNLQGLSFRTLEFGTWNFSHTMVSAISMNAETIKCDYGIWCLKFGILSLTRTI
jgi:hypothetical protein